MPRLLLRMCLHNFQAVLSLSNIIFTSSLTLAEIQGCENDYMIQMITQTDRQT